MKFLLILSSIPFCLVSALADENKESDPYYIPVTGLGDDKEADNISFPPPKGESDMVGFLGCMRKCSKVFQESRLAPPETKRALVIAALGEIDSSSSDLTRYFYKGAKGTLLGRAAAPWEKVSGLRSSIVWTDPKLPLEMLLEEMDERVKNHERLAAIFDAAQKGRDFSGLPLPDKIWLNVRDDAKQVIEIIPPPQDSPPVPPQNTPPVVPEVKPQVANQAAAPSAVLPPQPEPPAATARPRSLYFTLVPLILLLCGGIYFLARRRKEAKGQVNR